MIAQADKTQEIVDCEVIKTYTLSKQRLNNDREEAFCKNKANNDISDAKAYRDAGYSKNGAMQNGHRLISKDYIKDRIAYLRAENAVKAGVTQEKQAIKLERAGEIALEEGDVSTFIRATVDQSKHYGLMVDKTVTETTDAQRALEAKDKVLADKLAKALLDEAMGAKTGVLEVEQ